MGVDPTIIVAIVGAVAAIVTTYLQFRQRRRVDEVHEQVKNTHTTNLREDMDLVLDALHHLRRVNDGLRRDLRKERAERIEELRQERAERIRLQEQVDAELLRRRGSGARQ